MFNQIQLFTCEIIQMNAIFSGADPEKIESGGANRIKYQTEQQGRKLFFWYNMHVLGGAAPVVPL